MSHLLGFTKLWQKAGDMEPLVPSIAMYYEQFNP